MWAQTGGIPQPLKRSASNSSSRSSSNAKKKKKKDKKKKKIKEDRKSSKDSKDSKNGLPAALSAALLSAIPQGPGLTHATLPVFPPTPSGYPMPGAPGLVPGAPLKGQPPRPSGTSNPVTIPAVVASALQAPMARSSSNLSNADSKKSTVETKVDKVNSVDSKIESKDDRTKSKDSAKSKDSSVDRKDSKNVKDKPSTKSDNDETGVNRKEARSKSKGKEDKEDRDKEPRDTSTQRLFDARFEAHKRTRELKVANHFKNRLAVQINRERDSKNYNSKSKADSGRHRENRERDNIRKSDERERDRDERGRRSDDRDRDRDRYDNRRDYNRKKSYNSKSRSDEKKNKDSRDRRPANNRNRLKSRGKDRSRDRSRDRENRSVDRTRNTRNDARRSDRGREEDKDKRNTPKNRRKSDGSSKKEVKTKRGDSRDKKSSHKRPPGDSPKDKSRKKSEESSEERPEKPSSKEASDDSGEDKEPVKKNGPKSRKPANKTGAAKGRGKGSSTPKSPKEKGNDFPPLKAPKDQHPKTPQPKPSPSTDNKAVENNPSTYMLFPTGIADKPRQSAASTPHKSFLSTIPPDVNPRSVLNKLLQDTGPSALFTRKSPASSSAAKSPVVPEPAPKPAAKRKPRGSPTVETDDAKKAPMKQTKAQTKRQEALEAKRLEAQKAKELVAAQVKKADPKPKRGAAAKTNPRPDRIAFDDLHLLNKQSVNTRKSLSGIEQLGEDSDEDEAPVSSRIESQRAQANKRKLNKSYQSARSGSVHDSQRDEEQPLTKRQKQTPPKPVVEKPPPPPPPAVQPPPPRSIDMMRPSDIAREKVKALIERRSANNTPEKVQVPPPPPTRKSASSIAAEKVANLLARRMTPEKENNMAIAREKVRGLIEKRKSLTKTPAGGEKPGEFKKPVESPPKPVESRGSVGKPMTTTLLESPACKYESVKTRAERNAKPTEIKPNWDLHRSKVEKMKPMRGQTPPMPVLEDDVVPPVEDMVARIKWELAQTAKQKAREEEAKIAKMRAEEDARLKAQEEAKIRAQEHERLKAEQAAKRKAEEAARRKAEKVPKLQLPKVEEPKPETPRSEAVVETKEVKTKPTKITAVKTDVKVKTTRPKYESVKDRQMKLEAARLEALKTQETKLETVNTQESKLGTVNTQESKLGTVNTEESKPEDDKSKDEEEVKSEVEEEKKPEKKARVIDPSAPFDPMASPVVDVNQEQHSFLSLMQMEIPPPVSDEQKKKNEEEANSLLEMLGLTDFAQQYDEEKKNSESNAKNTEGIDLLNTSALLEASVEKNEPAEDSPKNSKETVSKSRDKSVKKNKDKKKKKKTSKSSSVNPLDPAWIAQQFASNWGSESAQTLLGIAYPPMLNQLPYHRNQYANNWSPGQQGKKPNPFAPQNKIGVQQPPGSQQTPGGAGAPIAGGAGLYCDNGNSSCLTPPSFSFSHNSVFSFTKKKDATIEQLRAAQASKYSFFVQKSSSQNQLTHLNSPLGGGVAPNITCPRSTTPKGTDVTAAALGGGATLSSVPTGPPISTPTTMVAAVGAPPPKPVEATPKPTTPVATAADGTGIKVHPSIKPLVIPGLPPGIPVSHPLSNTGIVSTIVNVNGPTVEAGKESTPTEVATGAAKTTTPTGAAETTPKAPTETVSVTRNAIGHSMTILLQQIATTMAAGGATNLQSLGKMQHQLSELRKAQEDLCRAEKIGVHLESNKATESTGNLSNSVQPKSAGVPPPSGPQQPFHSNVSTMQQEVSKTPIQPPQAVQQPTVLHTLGPTGMPLSLVIGANGLPVKANHKQMPLPIVPPIIVPKEITPTSVKSAVVVKEPAPVKNESDNPFARAVNVVTNAVNSVEAKKQTTQKTSANAPLAGGLSDVGVLAKPPSIITKTNPTTETDKTGSDKTGLDKTGLDKSRVEKTGNKSAKSGNEISEGKESSFSSPSGFKCANDSRSSECVS